MATWRAPYTTPREVNTRIVSKLHPLKKRLFNMVLAAETSYKINRRRNCQWLAISTIHKPNPWHLEVYQPDVFENLQLLIGEPSSY
jgi:hypothetical protein